MVYAFDLDSTLTKEETLPFVAKRLNCYDKYLGVCEEIEELSYDEGLVRRFKVFKSFSVESVAEVLNEIPVYMKLLNFVVANRECSYIVTSNLKSYVKKLAEQFGCKVYGSVDATSIINKRNVIEKLRQRDRVLFMGDGENDVEALKQADISIAAAYARDISENVKNAADFVAYSEDEAVSFLVGVA